MRCKKQILLPFRKLLCLVRIADFAHTKKHSGKMFSLLQIGWRPFGADSWSHSSLLLRIINIVYPICILLLLLFNYAYEIIICQGKLNVITDTQVRWHFDIALIFANDPFDLDDDDHHHNDYRSHHYSGIQQPFDRYLGHIATRSNSTDDDEYHDIAFSCGMWSHIHYLHPTGYIPFRGVHHWFHSFSRHRR